MCDPNSARINFETPHGSLLQMSRMIPRNPTKAWDSSPSSTEDESSEVIPPVQPLHLQTFHTLQSMTALSKKIEEQQQKERNEEREERKRQRETEASQDPNSLLVKTAFNLGVEAGRKQRDPPKPCETCENRKKKNRDAARLARELARRRADAGSIKHHGELDDDSD